MINYINKANKEKNYKFKASRSSSRPAPVDQYGNTKQPAEHCMVHTMKWTVYDPTESDNQYDIIILEDTTDYNDETS